MSDYLNLPKVDYSSNLIAKWVFDDTDTSKVNGNTIYDQSGNGNDLASTNVTYVDDTDLGRCAYFNGSSSCCSSSTMKIPTGKKTVIIKFKTIINNVYQYLINSGDCYRVGHDIYINTENKMICGHRYGATVSSNTVLKKNKPIIFKYSYDNNLIRIFMDNLANLDSSSNTTIDNANNTNYFNIGRVYNSDSNNYYFKGYLQSIEIYNEVVEHINNAYLIKDGNKCYSFKNDEYISPYYNEITETLSKDIFYDKGQWNINKLFTETTIGSETFRPIDKFNNPQIVSYIQNDKVIINGIKSNKELIIAKQPFSTRLAKNIDFFELISEISDTSNIKLVVSVDDGLTWKTYKDNIWTNLTNVCPLKEYSSMTDTEKNLWNNFKDEVDTNGIDSSVLKDIDFNPILSDSMMFAYVLNRNSYEDNCAMSKLQYRFDAHGKYTLLTSDVEIGQSTDAITITPKKDIELMKVNVGSSGNITINNGGDIEIQLDDISYTDDEINNVVNQVIRGE